MADESKDISDNKIDLSKNDLDLSKNVLDLSNNILDISKNDLDLSNNNEITCLCFSGGGIKGFSFIGVLEKLVEHKKIDLNKIDMYVGTSAGSMISFFLILGFSIDEIKEFVITFNFSKLNGEIDCVNLLENFGINNGERMKLLFIKFLEIKFKLKDITFNELYNKTKKKLLIVGTNLTKGQEELFSVDTTPDMSVITAIRISISVPVIFTPVSYNNYLYVDGALVNNFPINYCPKNNTFGIYVKNCNENFEIDSIQSFIFKCLNVTSDTISEKNLNSDCKNIIKIINPKPEFTKFDLTPEYKKDLIELGYKTANEYFNLII
jgi:predicted acylesterase/phospholipase RssA